MDADWVLQLPWRSPPLSLNRQPGHPVTHAAVKREIKTAAWALAKQKRIPKLSAIMVELVWYKGDNRRADGDNMATTLKPLIDGLVQAKVIPDDDSERVISSLSRVVLRRNTPDDNPAAYMVLAIQDASALGPIDTYYPPPT